MSFLEHFCHVKREESLRYALPKVACGLLLARSSPGLLLQGTTISPFTYLLARLQQPGCHRRHLPASQIGKGGFWGVNLILHTYDRCEQITQASRCILDCMSIALIYSTHHFIIHFAPEADGTSGIISAPWCLFQSNHHWAVNFIRPTTPGSERIGTSACKL